MQKLMKHYQKNPIIIDVTHHKLEAPKIEQVYFEMRESTKPEALTRLLDLHNVKCALVFCNTKLAVDSLVEKLKTRGYFADGLHGDLAQKQRDKVMQNFRNGTVEILVATDVAGRGIDVNDIEAVFNYDLPQDDEDYIHRIGRTARAGKKGIAFTFIVGKQIYNLKRIEKTNGVKIARRQIPSIEDLDVIRMKSLGAHITEVLEEGHLRKYTDLVEEFMGDEYTAIDVAAALLKDTLENKKDVYDESVKFDDDYESDMHRNSQYRDRRGNGGGYRRNDGYGRKDNNYSRNDGGSRGEGSRSEGGRPFEHKDKSSKYQSGGFRDRFITAGKFDKDKKKKFGKGKFDKKK
jgi:ATP-dependent RNA helicase DeaD